MGLAPTSAIALNHPPKQLKEMFESTDLWIPYTVASGPFYTSIFSDMAPLGLGERSAASFAA